VVEAACLGKTSPGDAEAERAAGAVVALDRSADGRPLRGPAAPAGATVLVAVPADIEALRPRDPDGARQWRVAVRETLGSMMDAGTRVTGFDRAGWYVLTNSPRRTGEA
jgi:predicted GNAT superfamily acetyltransferase